MKHLLVLLAACLSLVGCIDLEQTWTLNPDGSGKLLHHAVFQPFSLNFDGGADPEDAMRDAVQQTLDDSEGIAAWENVSFRLTDAGKIEFTGTAYFDDISAVKIATGGSTMDMFSPTLSTDASGKLTLTMTAEESDGSPGLPPADLAGAVKEQKAQFAQMKPMMVAMLGEMKSAQTFHLPGTLANSTNFEKGADGSVGFAIKGSDLIAALDAMMNDTAWLEEQVAKGVDLSQEGPAIDGKMNEQLFGSSAPLSATFTGAGEASFDYASAVAKAREAYPAMLESLGLDGPVERVAAADGSGFDSLVVGGVRLVRDLGLGDDIRPFNYPPGYTLSMVGKLNGGALDCEAGELTRAVDSAGNSLLPPSDFDRRISFPEVSEDGQYILFDLELALPGPGVDSIRELAGELTYITGSATAETDLGFTSLAEGSEGSELRATILTNGESSWQEGKHELAVEITADPAMLKELYVTDAAGKRLPTDVGGSGYSGDQVTRTLSADGPFPTDGKVVAVLYTDTKKYRVPFTVENVSLLGETH